MLGERFLQSRMVRVSVSGARNEKFLRWSPQSQSD